MSETLQLAQALISRPSVTPDDQACQSLMTEKLAPLGFTAEQMRFGEVDNLWLRRGTAQPLLCFAGHTDVVPTGPLAQWHSDPFQPEVRDGMLYGRGAADMKGSIAAFVVACKQFVQAHPDHRGSIAFLITSDEEGPAHHGTVKVIETLQARQEKIDWCLVGEPSSTAQVGDVIKNGRRGSFHAQLMVLGKQGHVAYPQLANNPIHRVAPALAELAQTEWDQGNDFFPPTSFQVSNIHAGTGANNVVPGQIDITMNWRFSTELSAEAIRTRTEAILAKHELDYQVDWHLSGEPFLTAEGELVAASVAAIEEITGRSTQLSTAGGTSDGRFIAPTGAQVLELGPLNATIHQVNECVAVADLETLTAIYQRILEKLLL